MLRSPRDRSTKIYFLARLVIVLHLLAKTSSKISTLHDPSLPPPHAFRNARLFKKVRASSNAQPKVASARIARESMRANGTGPCWTWRAQRRRRPRIKAPLIADCSRQDLRRDPDATPFVTPFPCFQKCPLVIKSAGLESFFSSLRLYREWRSHRATRKRKESRGVSKETIILHKITGKNQHISMGLYMWSFHRKDGRGRSPFNRTEEKAPLPSTTESLVLER